jgi:pimeloyl-ACP methyl ester carboxylesterase
MNLEHTHVKTNGISLHTVQAGPEDGPLVILLHGFPEFWYCWRKQIEPLANAGFRVLAPDQRGYNLSDKPNVVQAYNQNELSADVFGLIDAMGRDTVYLVGHDWGGAMTWWTAAKYPERIAKIVLLNCPHHRPFGKALRTDNRQRRMSWYMAFFQIPAIPETVLRLGNWRTLARAVANSAKPGTFTEAELAEYRKAWSQPGAMTAMVNWYRAARVAQFPNRDKIKPPTLMIWGKQDHFLSWQLAQPSIDQCESGRLVFIDDATHWVQHEAAEQVNQLIIDFLKS